MTRSTTSVAAPIINIKPLISNQNASNSSIKQTSVSDTRKTEPNNPKKNVAADRQNFEAEEFEDRIRAY